jgi:hypothetical protein
VKPFHIALVPSVLIGPLLATSPLWAHHSVAAQYDIQTTKNISGNIAGLEFVNPHVNFWVDSADKDGNTTRWEFELSSGNALRNAGVGKMFVTSGEHVSVSFWPAKDGSKLGHAIGLTFADGRTLSFPRDWMGQP